MSPGVKAAPARLRGGILWGLLALTSGCGQPDDTDTTRPFIRITFPAEFTLLSDIVTVRVDARDNVGLRHVTYMAPGDSLPTISNAPYALLWNTTAYPDCTDVNSFVVLTATAEDLAGNTRSTTRKFYLDNEGLPPLPVALFPPANITKHSALISWAPSPDYDFSHYLLYRDTSASVTASSDSLVRNDTYGATAFTDTGAGVSPFGLLEDTDYHYRVYVHDVFGRSTASDSIVTVRTLLPVAVPLISTGPPSKYRARLEWIRSTEDVAYFRLHRGLAADAASLDSIAGFLPIIATTHTDSGLTANTTYYYYLYLIDAAGYTHEFSEDDVLELTTLALPAPVLVDPPTAISKYSVTLAWESIPPQEDSSWVALYRGSGLQVDSTDVLAYSAPITDGVLNHKDEPLPQGQTFSYALRHWDSRNNIAWSNSVTSITLSLADVWSGGLGVRRQDKYELKLAWDIYTYAPEQDFARYTLRRGSTVIFTFTDVGDDSYTDTGLSRASSYTYRLEVADTSGATAEVTLVTSTRDIFPAEIVSLEPDTSWSYRLAWLPTAEPEGEFKHYAILRTADNTVVFRDDDGNNLADCLPGDCVEVTTIPGRGVFGIDTLIYDDQDPALVQGTLTSLPIYNYVVLTYDEAGEYAPSNIVGDTLYAPPSLVTLEVINNGGSPTTISLQWSRAAWPSPSLDNLAFDSYEVWRNSIENEEPGQPGSTYEQIIFFTDINTTSHTDSPPLIDATPWYYRIILKDNFGQAAMSDEELGLTSP